MTDKQSMEVNPNIRVAAASELATPPLAKAAAPAQADQTAFAGSNSLNQALQQLPDARPEKVDQATDAANSPEYPPEATIDAIARLLGAEISKGQE